MIDREERGRAPWEQQGCVFFLLRRRRPGGERKKKEKTEQKGERKSFLEEHDSREACSTRKETPGREFAANRIVGMFGGRTIAKGSFPPAAVEETKEGGRAREIRWGRY